MKAMLHMSWRQFGAVAVLSAFCALSIDAQAAVSGTTATFDTAGSVDGWESDNAMVPLSNPGGWLETEFVARFGPSLSETCRTLATSNTLDGALTGNFVKSGIAEITFDFRAVEACPSFLELRILSGSGREWYRRLEVTQAGDWVTFSVPVAFKERWADRPEPDEQMFWNDMRDVRQVAVYVSRSARWEAEHYRVDNFSVKNGPGRDSDQDGMNDLLEVSAWTDPYSAASLLKITSGHCGDDGVVVKWASVTGPTYAIYSTTNLLNGFLPLASGLPSTPPENVYTDMTATGMGPYFYRIAVEP